MRRPALLLLVALAGVACFYQPPAQPPSSVRILYSKSTSDSLGADVDIYFVVARSGNELRLTGEEGVDRQPVFDAGELRVYFTRETGGRSEIWSMAFDGSDERRVLGADGADYRDPAPSPDGARLAYTRVQGGPSQVVVADAEGTEPRVVTAGRQPAWSPDGRTLAVVTDQGGVPRIQLVGPDGGAARPLSVEPGAQAEPAWHPDGSRIAFKRGAGNAAEIAVATVAGGGIAVLTDNGVEDGQPDWSPAGDRVVFVSRLSDGKWGLRIVGAEGGEVETFLERDDVDAADPDWL
ncbi:MAG TPA: hypothetical protein VM778_06700 [Gemmatimonadota bacterium]|nr:hypothetical protein [Gemmatimonadota bacterium]